MIVVDTSVWVDMFRGLDTELDSILERGKALIHPFVLGELKLGGLPKRGAIGFEWPEVAQAPVGTVEEVDAFIDRAELAGTGLGYVDAHLLVSARLAEGNLLTHDTRLHAQAQRLGVAYEG